MAHQAVQADPPEHRLRWNEDPNLFIGLLCTLGVVGVTLFVRVHVAWGLLAVPSAIFALWVSLRERRGRHQR